MCLTTTNESPNKRVKRQLQLTGRLWNSNSNISKNTYSQYYWRQYISLCATVLPASTIIAPPPVTCKLKKPSRSTYSVKLNKSDHQTLCMHKWTCKKTTWDQTWQSCYAFLFCAALQSHSQHKPLTSQQEPYKSRTFLLRIGRYLRRRPQCNREQSWMSYCLQVAS